MEKKHQYFKYKDALKNQCILSSVGAIVALLSIVLLVFIPFLAMKVEGETVFTMSLFDAMKDSVETLKGNSQSLFVFYCFYQVFAAIYLVVAIILLSVNVAKGLGNITNIEGYTIETYDNIKFRRDNERSSRRGRRGALSYFVSAICMEALYIFMCTYLTELFPEEELLKNPSDILFINGFEMTIIFPVIFIVATIVLLVMSKTQLRKIKTSIIKEEYETSNDVKEEFNNAEDANNNI